MNNPSKNVSSCCLPAVCLLVIGRALSVSVVVDVQSFCVVGSGGILNRSGPLPLGSKLVIWDINTMSWLKILHCREHEREG